MCKIGSILLLDSKTLDDCLTLCTKAGVIKSLLAKRKKANPIAMDMYLLCIIKDCNLLDKIVESFMLFLYSNANKQSQIIADKLDKEYIDLKERLEERLDGVKLEEAENLSLNLPNIVMTLAVVKDTVDNGVGGNKKMYFSLCRKSEETLA